MQGIRAFQSSRHLALLRAGRGSTHVFLRQDNEITYIPVMQDAPTVGALDTFWTYQSAGLVRRLIQEVLTRPLTAWRFKLLDFDPPRFVARHPGHDLLARITGTLAGVQIERGAQHWR